MKAAHTHSRLAYVTGKTLELLPDVTDQLSCETKWVCVVKLIDDEEYNNESMTRTTN